MHNIIAADAYILRAELRAGAPDVGIESTLASFMRQAELFQVGRLHIDLTMGNARPLSS